VLPAPPELFFANMISGSSIVKVDDSIVVVEPFTVKLPPTVTLPDDSIVVNFPDAGTYDAILIAVAHHQFIEMGEKAIRALGKSEHVLYDLKYILPANASDLRL